MSPTLQLRDGLQDVDVNKGARRAADISYSNYGNPNPPFFIIQRFQLVQHPALAWTANFEDALNEIRPRLH